VSALRGAKPISDAILVPSTRDLIFWKAISRATSGEPCFGFKSILKGEKPQSSVEPSLERTKTKGPGVRLRE
jgi:hypothetical protein